MPYAGPERYLIATQPLPTGGKRAYYSHSQANVRAAHAALARDPGLLALVASTADSYEDTP